MNFNYNQDTSKEYELFKNQTKELIHLYGLNVKYLITEKVNKDIIFGEYSHIKIDNTNIFPMYMLPEETDGWGDGGSIYSNFEFSNLDTQTMYIAVDDMETIHPNIPNRIGKGWDFIIGNLVVFPNNKIMEVTDFEHEVKGLNNLFPYDTRKNVYSIKIKQYIANRDDYSTADGITESDEVIYTDFGNLAEILGVNDSTKIEQDDMGEEIPNINDVIFTNPTRTKAIREYEDNVFGDLG